MGSLLVELVPFAVGLAITPTAIAVSILFLGSKRPIGNAFGFAAAFAFVYAGLAVLVLALTGGASGLAISDRVKHLAALAVGLLLLALALLSVLRGRRRTAGQRPRWLAAVDSARPVEAFGIGVALATVNPNVPILLAGLVVIGAANAPAAVETGAVAFLIVASEVGLVGPAAWYLIRPVAGKRVLDRLSRWLGRHERAVDLAVLLVFGALFTIKGTVGLGG